jgi:hypothetical protein
MKTASTRALGAGLVVYLTPEHRERLHEVLKAEGIYSASGWLRYVVVQKIQEADACPEAMRKDAGGRPEREPVNAGR